MSTHTPKETLTAYRTITATLPSDCTLIAVSKFHPAAAIETLYRAGHRDFGENRVQELLSKVDALPSDIRWHMIGTLQRNKVKQLIPYVDTIHSIDTIRLLDEVEKQCAAKGRESVSVLLQVHISGESTKHGFAPGELLDFFDRGEHLRYRHARISGLMAMAALTDDTGLIDRQFAEVQKLYTHIRETFYPHDPTFRHLSIGMSDDYPLALRHCATYIRIGTAIFGEREY